MSCIRRFGCLLLIVLAAVVPVLLGGAADDAPKARQYALLVGVKNYNKDELRNLDSTENDVNDRPAIASIRGVR